MIVALLGIWLTLLVSKGTPIGGWLHRILAVAPANWLSSWTRGQVALLGALIGMTVLMILVFGHHGAEGLLFSLPEALSTLASVEVTAYLDTMIAVWTAASVLRAGQGLRWMRARFSSRRTTRRAARAARRTRPQGPANDDEGPAFATALRAEALPALSRSAWPTRRASFGSAPFARAIIAA